MYEDKFEDRKEKLNTAITNRPTKKNNHQTEKVSDTNRSIRKNNNLPEKTLNINRPTKKDIRYKKTYQRGHKIQTGPSKRILDTKKSTRKNNDLLKRIITHCKGY